jgi:uncharacterized protein YcbK (DUF882 family)
MSEQATTNFKWSEVECKCSCGGRPKSEFMDKLQELRDMVGFPLRINSGYRCAKHNAAIGGAKASRHQHGFAADIDWTVLTGEQKFNLLGSAACLFQGLGISEDFLHVDSRDKYEVWTY